MYVFRERERKRERQRQRERERDPLKEEFIPTIRNTLNIENCSIPVHQKVLNTSVSKSAQYLCIEKCSILPNQKMLNTS